MKRKKSLTYYILLIVGVLVLINILSDRFFFRLDFTADKRYTLSGATKDILHSLTQPVTITAYFSENLPPDVAKTRRDFKDLLVEYRNASKGMIVYEFVNPNKDEEAEQRAMKAGVQPVLINMREKDQVKQQKAFLGAVVQMGEQSDIIPFMEPGAAMEYALSSSIKKLSVIEKPNIGVLQGHGEPALNQLRQVNEALSVLYNVEPVTLTDTTDELGKYATVAIVAPKDSFPPGHLMQLDNYLAQGNNLFIAMDRVEGDLNTAYGETINTGLETWLSRKGLNVENNFVVDQQSGAVTVMQQQGMFTIQSQVQFPYIPIITNFEEHPISKGLEQVVLQFASSISFMGDSTLNFTPIARTSEKSGTKSSPTYFNVQKQWTSNDFPLSGLAVAGVLEGKIVGDNNARMVVVSDGNFPVNGESRGGRGGQINPDNANLMVNAIDWLSDDTGLIELRTKGVSSRPIDQLEDSKKTFLKYLNFLLPIILIIIYGIIRMQTKQSLRIKRMEEGYV